MSEPTQDNLIQIEEKLASIEQKIGSKWTLPIVVAVISGLIGIITVAIQVKLEADRADAAKVREQILAAQSDERKEGKEFFLQMQALARDVSKNYKVQCSRTEPTEEQLINVLEKFRDLAETNRALYGDEFTDNVQAYGDWVADSFYDRGKANCGQENDIKYRALTNALKDFYNSRCIIRTLEEQRPPRLLGLL